MKRTALHFAIVMNLVGGFGQFAHAGEGPGSTWAALATACMTHSEPTLSATIQAPVKRVDGFERVRQYLQPTAQVTADCRRTFLHFAYGSPQKTGVLYSPAVDTWVNENDALAASWWPLDRGLNAAKTQQRFDLHNAYPAVKSDNRLHSPSDYKIASKGTAGANCTACETAEITQNVGGDMARAALYMSAMYGPTSAKKDPLAISDEPQQAIGGNRFGPLCQLLAWAIADPVSEEEMHRHRVAARIQGNTNPFVLDPSLTSELWGLRCNTWGFAGRN